MLFCGLLCEGSVMGTLGDFPVQACNIWVVHQRQVTWARFVPQSGSNRHPSRRHLDGGTCAKPFLNSRQVSCWYLIIGQGPGIDTSDKLFLSKGLLTSVPAVSELMRGALASDSIML